MSTSSFLAGPAGMLGVSVAALRLLISIILSYPIALAHRKYLFGKPPTIQHVFFFGSGLILGLFNFGFDIVHSLVNVIIVYGILKIFGGRPSSYLTAVMCAFGFSMLYLLTGYVFTATENYDIVWTMPHCTLVLKLTSLAFDLYDGSMSQDKLSKDSKRLALKEVPSLLEVFAYSFFPTSFLVGPIFSMKKYQDYTAGKLKEPDQVLPDCVEAAVKRGLLGAFYLIVHTVVGLYYSEEYILGDQFLEQNLFKRWIDVGIWGHIVLYKYISIWLITEGACILIGLGYNGRDENNKIKYDGCANVDVYLFETARNFTYEYISSFNINTNFWVMHYIYKRLKFLNNKLYSQLGVLLFLSVWHGLHSGYYVCFFMEFISVNFEKDLEVILKRNKVLLEFIQQPVPSAVLWVILKLYTVCFMGVCVGPLALLTYEKWWRLYSSTFWMAQILWGFWFLYKPLVKRLLPPARETPD